MQIIFGKRYTIPVENRMENLIRNQNMQSTCEDATISLIGQ